GRHHLGIRGRLFLGIGGRDHFGIRGRIASEFALCSCDWKTVAKLLAQMARLLGMMRELDIRRGRSTASTITTIP
ncbi:hypothetical protein CN203_27550, partial [Sinorhizobium meliloti]